MKDRDKDNLDKAVGDVVVALGDRYPKKHGFIMFSDGTCYENYGMGITNLK